MNPDFDTHSLCGITSLYLRFFIHSIGVTPLFFLCFSSAPRCWRKGYCWVLPGPCGATAHCRLSSGVGRGGRSDHMIWVLQPLLGQVLKPLPPLIFEKSCPAQPCSQIIIRKGRRSGFSLCLDLFQPAVLPLFPTRRPTSCSPPSLSSSSALHAGRAEFSCFTEFPCPSSPDGQSQILNTQL